MSPLQVSRPLMPLTQAQYAYNELRSAITTGQLPGGAHIVQSEWAARLDVSITPIREAIRRLEQDGLARSEAHKGTTVNPFSIDRAAEIVSLRKALDPMQFRRVAESSPSRAAHAAELYAKMQELNDPVQFSDLDLEFHRVVMGIDESWTARLTQTLIVASSPYVAVALAHNPRLLEKENEHHAQFVAALKAGDVEGLIELNEQHVSQVFHALQDVDLPSVLGN
ncbi:GntR family transcriptional regulator [Corynebacterium hindlerae]|uniref:GntR family transcriptional regulator n=1 Tax=Corynebacterium hindlerae TaxID=699041 RepID=UPI001AD76D01|nr:GntR family transcriptional regulator [Corynebacterium hindlerae]QTH58516.1 GntR family transcriptional regulator [Corynebacterium hindlerae]